ncbi:hypothetical protein EXN66_Car021197 [Channa argus]|uniref:Uncharacterized protein n=1 Tax=Channa argus TaxID=215402 RepID=A0A6G1QTU9_CHAAH|nr:hypothetical protein EXN66_Car021197 [Channa argus]
MWGSDARCLLSVEPPNVTASPLKPALVTGFSHSFRSKNDLKWVQTSPKAVFPLGHMFIVGLQLKPNIC